MGAIVGQVWTGLGDAAIGANKLVKLDSNGLVTACAAMTDNPIGVMLETANANYTCAVQINGIAYVELGDTVDEGDRIGADSNGYGVALPAAEETDFTALWRYAWGRALKAGVVGDIIPVLHQPTQMLTHGT